MKISVVIPTRNRLEQLKRVLQTLQAQTFRPAEIIIVDSSDNDSIDSFKEDLIDISVSYIRSTPSVCIQRNLGIKSALFDWIFLCDDDLELPADYLYKLISHATRHSEAGAISGLFLQKYKGEWQAQYPVTSSFELWWRFIFQLSIWGEVRCSDNAVNKVLKNYYRRKGNHISNGGWPVITDFSGDYLKTPMYTLGGSLIKKEWLLNSPFDEVLDPHGIGDNYGVSLGFPSEGIHIVNSAFVYHHEALENRLESPLQYYRRVLALHYFLETNKRIKHVKTYLFLWSLIGDILRFFLLRKASMAIVTCKVMGKIIANKNPYLLARKTGLKVVVPLL